MIGINVIIDDKDLIEVEKQDQMTLFFSGFLILPSDAVEYHRTSNLNLLQKPNNRMFYISSAESKQWVFDYSVENRGIWFEKQTMGF